MLVYEHVSRNGETNIHRDAQHHQSGVEAHQGGVFREAMVAHDAKVDGAKEVVIQSRVDEEDEDFRSTIPILVYRNQPGFC